jgi:hypothetical protein
MKKNYINLFSCLFLILFGFTGCDNKKTIKEAVQEGRTSYMVGTWDISFKIFSSEKPEPYENIKMTAIIANETDAHNIKNVSEVELIKYENNNEIKEKISFDDLLLLLDDFDQKFYIKHDLKKLKRNDPSFSYFLRGSRYAKRDNKDKEYYEIIANQKLIKKGKKSKEDINIVFEMEKRIRKPKEYIYD